MTSRCPSARRSAAAAARQSRVTGAAAAGGPRRPSASGRRLARASRRRRLALGARRCAVAPIRSGRLAGSVPSTPSGPLGIRFPLGACPPSLGVYAWIRDPPPLIIREDRLPPTRSAAQRRISDRPKTAWWKSTFAAPRLSRDGSVGEGGHIALPQDLQAHISRKAGSHRASLERDIHVCCGSARTRRSQGADPQGSAGGRAHVRRDHDCAVGDGRRRDAISRSCTRSSRRSEIELVEEIDPALAAGRRIARPISAAVARRRRRSTSSRT